MSALALPPPAALPAAANCCEHSSRAAEDAAKLAAETAILEAGFPEITFDGHEENQYDGISHYVELRLAHIIAQRDQLSTSVDRFRAQLEELDGYSYKKGKLAVDIPAQIAKYNEGIELRKQYIGAAEAASQLKIDVDTCCDTTLVNFHKKLEKLAEDKCPDEVTKKRTPVRARALHAFRLAMGHLQIQVDATLKVVTKRMGDESFAGTSVMWRLRDNGGRKLSTWQWSRLKAMTYTPETLEIPTEAEVEHEDGADSSGEEDNEVKAAEGGGKATAAATTEEEVQKGGKPKTPPIPASDFEDEGFSTPKAELPAAAVVPTDNGNKGKAAATTKGRNLLREVDPKEAAGKKMLQKDSKADRAARDAAGKGTRKGPGKKKK